MENPNIEEITSLQNPKVRKLLLLQQKSSERRDSGLFVVEGRRELMHCQEAGYEIDTVFTVDGDVDVRAGRVFRVTPAVYEKMAYRGGTEGVIAEVRTRKTGLNDLNLGEQPLIVVLESVEKPESLQSEPEPTVPEFITAVGDDSITRFDNPERKKRSRGRSGRGGQKGRNGGDRNREPQQPKEGQQKESHVKEGQPKEGQNRGGNRDRRRGGHQPRGGEQKKTPEQQ